MYSSHGRRFRRVVIIVAVVHVAILILISAYSLVRTMIDPEPEVDIPVTLVFESQPADPAPSTKPPVPAELPPPPPEPTPAPTPPVVKPEPAPPPKPIRKPKEIQVSKTLVSRPGPSRPAPALPAEDIARALMDDLPTTENVTTTPSEERLGFARIRRILYEAWIQPSREEAGDKVVVASITLDRKGNVTSSRLSRGSGNAVLDGSVLQALEAVTHISGLTPGFLAAHPSVSISFKVE